MAAEVAVSQQARDDLFSIYIWVAEAADLAVADGYDARLRKACLSLADVPHRGTPHEELAPGLRSIPFERRATIFYRVTDEHVEIVRVLPKGRDTRRAFDAG